MSTPRNFVDSTRSRELSLTVSLRARSANLWWDDVCWVKRTMNLVLLGFKARLESLDHGPSLVRDSYKLHVVDSNSLTAQWV